MTAPSGPVSGAPSRMASGGGVGSGGVGVAGGKPKKEVLKKKSDKNLKALALIQTIGKEFHFSSDERIHLSTMFVRNFGAEKHPGLKLYAIDARGFQRIMHATFGITNEKIIEGSSSVRLSVRTPVRASCTLPSASPTRKPLKVRRPSVCPPVRPSVHQARYLRHHQRENP